MILHVKGKPDRALCGELSPEIEALNIAMEQVAEAERKAVEARTAVAYAARRYMLEAETEQDRIDRAAKVYWGVPEVEASEVSSVLFGDPKRIHKTLELLGSAAPSVQCSRCGSTVKVNSRSQLKDINRTGKRARPFVCKTCLDDWNQQGSDEFIAEQEARFARIKVLRSMPYREYLVTDEWLATRNQKLRSAGFRCQLCNSGGLLNVHHRTYERRGCEDMRDLIVLCHPCHAKFHDKLP